MSQFVLSVFTGAGLLDKAFRDNGFIVVSAGDIVYNIDGDIRNFKGIKNKFDGLIGGPRCQDFSSLKRNKPDKYNCYGWDMLQEFKRVVLECQPNWALLENVRETPDLLIDDYTFQRIDINQSWYEDVNRLRHIQFYSKKSNPLFLHFERGVTDPGKKNKCDSAALASDDRTFKQLLKLQGLEENINFPDFTVKGKKKLIGNGVPLSIGNVLAQAVFESCKTVTDQSQKRCKCPCKRIVTHQGKYYDYSCRKRFERLKNL